jgi:hypothetical protein
MEREKFEDSLKDAFDKAEISPSESVWTNIELDLEKAEGGKMKRSLLFFKLLAAASIVFAMGVGSTFLYVKQQQNEATQITLKENQITTDPTNSKQQQPVNNNSKTQRNLIAENGRADLSGANTRANQTKGLPVDEKIQRDGNAVDGSQKITAISDTYPETSDNNHDVSNQTELHTQNIIGAVDVTRQSETSELLFYKKPSSSLVSNKQAQIHLPKQEEADPVALMLARLNAEEEAVKNASSKKQSTSEKLWTSVGFAAGSFNTVSSGISPSTSNTFLASNSQVADKEATASGTAYSVGVNMGTKLSTKWVLQGGVNYLTQSSDYTAQAAVGSSNFQNFRPASINEFDKLNESEGGQNQDKLVATAPYNVNNNVQYLSVPLQAGYMIIDKKFALQLNAGVSTELFLQNTRSADGQNFDKVTQGRGADSPYRPVNFSGLAGTEISYKFGSRYRLSLNPGLRYPFRSVYKSDIGVQSTPLTFDVGLRFRYIFH